MLTSESVSRKVVRDRATEPVVIDLFGAAGWGKALQARELTTVALSVDTKARATAHAAGHGHVPVDPVASSPLSPARKPCALVSSPPPHMRSDEPLGAADVMRVIACGLELSVDLDHRERHRSRSDSKDGMLLVEPLRWVLRLRPDWFAFEQAPAALPVWEFFADLLAGLGYQCAVGIVHAETFGVPQTRKHAVLVGSKVRTVQLPEPRHERAPLFDGPDEGPLPPPASSGRALNLASWGTLSKPSPVRQGQKTYLRTRSLFVPAFALDGTAADWRISSQARVWQTTPTALRHGLPSLMSALGSGTRCPRLTANQAGVLQGFPADYPWQGTRSEQFRQIVNAVPPAVVAALVEAAAGPSGEWPA